MHWTHSVFVWTLSCFNLVFHNEELICVYLCFCISLSKGSVTPGKCMKNAQETRWKMVCALLFVIIRYSFVERSAPTFFICDHLLPCIELRAWFWTYMLCAELNAQMYMPEGRRTCARSDGPTPDTRDTRRALARYSLYVHRLRCSEHP